MDLEVERAEQGLPPPTLQEQARRKPGSGPNPQISVKQVTDLLEACTLNKTQRKKLWHIVASEEGSFDFHRRTIEKKLRERGLRRCKSTKKLDINDIQRAQRYELALSRQHWGLAEWRMVIFSDEASIIVSAKRGQQKLSRFSDEKYHRDCIERQYNNYSEAMFWSCFTYDFKGPCHIYYPETLEQTPRNKELMDQLNGEEIDAECREAFNKREREKEKK